ncbi:MAG: hypothetical protein Q4E87_07540 [bacterium]|nr:hypothetical protein [bacterium]
MKELMIAVVSGMLLVQGAFAQTAQDLQLQANAGNAAVQAELDQPDGVAITIKPDGSFQIFARGTGTYDFNDPDDVKDARRDGTMRAKANLSKFLKEKVASSEGLEEVSRKSKSMTSDGQVQKIAVSKESVKTATESIRSASEAILTGVITLKDQKVPRGNGGEVQVTVGVSSKTLRAAQMAAQGINQSLQNRDAAVGETGTEESTVLPSQPNTGSTRQADTDF